MRIKCATFDPALQAAIPKDIKARMDRDRDAAQAAKEQLFTCPVCGQPNFTARGLRAHRGTAACRTRKEGDAS